YTILYLTYFLYFSVVSVFGPYLTPYYRSLGFSMLQIGILAATGSIAAILIQPFWSHLADRLGYRLRVLRIVVAGTAAGILLLALPRTFAGMLVLVAVFQAFFTAIIPVQDAVSLTYCNHVGRSYAGVRIGGPIGYAIVVLFTGRLAGETPQDMRRMFIVAAAGFALLYLLSFAMPRDGSGVAQRKIASVGTLLRNRRLTLFLAYMFAYQFALTLLFNFIALHIRDIGLTNRHVGYAMCIAAATEIPVLLLIDRVLRRRSPAMVLLAAGFVLTARLLLTARADSFADMALAQGLHGLCFMTAFYSGMQFVNREVPEELKASGVGLLTLVTAGFASILSSVTGGWLADRLSLQTLFRLDAGFVLTLSLAGTAVYLFRSRIPLLRRPPAA
ncbi:MAG: MFS transporter, partial [Clostridia bacterium]|nr:MFS transporter [Clostridia bacterium]